MSAANGAVLILAREINTEDSLMKTTPRGGRNPLQTLRLQQLRLLPPFGIALCALLAGLLVLATGDLGRVAYAFVRAGTIVAGAATLAILRCWLRLSQRIAAAHAHQRAASQRAYQARSAR